MRITTVSLLACALIGKARARYRLAKRAFVLAFDSWKSATSLYRRTRRRMRAFRHEAYRARRAVRQEWR